MMGCAPPRLLLGCALVLLPLSLQSHGRVAAADWRVCDVRDHGAVGDGLSSDSVAIRSALDVCDEVVLPAAHTFLSGPLNLTSNQRLNVQGTLLASVDKADYPLVLPMTGYGWGDDENCFPPNVDRHKIIIGSLRYSPVIGSYNASNVSVVGSGTIDGRGEIWWQNCTACHYPPHNQSSFCEIASRPKLLEFQFVHGLQVQGESAGAALHLKDSPFWTLTPSYSEDVHVANLRITAPMDRIGNTDGVNIDSCRRVLVENVYINNSDDGVCMKSGLEGFGLNLGIPSEDVLVQNITCDDAGRGGFAIGSEMSGGVRNVTYRNSRLGGGPNSRGIDIKPSVGRGGFMMDMSFENIHVPKNINFGMGRDGVPLMPGNDFVPLVANLHFSGITGISKSGRARCSFAACHQANGSKCFGHMSFVGKSFEGASCTPPGPPLPPRSFGCKKTAKTLFGEITLPWGVCIDSLAPVNLNPEYPNWGPTEGDYDSLASCKASCK